MAQLTLTLEQERQASSQLTDRAEQERLALHWHLQELQVQLETEQAKTLEVSAALGQEKERRAGAIPPERRPSGAQEEDEERMEEEESLLERLQRELDHKHAQVRFHFNFFFFLVPQVKHQQGKIIFLHRWWTSSVRWRLRGWRWCEKRRS